MKRKLFIISSLLLLMIPAMSQEKLKLNDVLSTISANHPGVKGFDAQIRSLDEAAKGAKNWEAPLLSSGL